MASTSAFGWETPDDTDLVKDGAAAIRTLGNSIDTSMADLKGGTSGQVLSKASNTDMDFTWVTSDDANAIQNAIVDAKGDLIAASAADTPARLAVGNNGETLVADSYTSTGLRYNPSITAGKNALINGAFDIWQRGTSFTNPAGVGAYNADRWCSYFNANGTITQETTVKPDTSTYSLKITATATSSSNDLYQLIEQLQMEQFRGKVVTLSVKVAGTATLAPELRIAYSTTANDSLFNTNTDITATVVANPAINPSTFVTYISQFTIPTTAKTLRIGLWSKAVVNTDVIYWAEAQLEIGSTATNFSRAGGTIQGELAACQRYYWRNTMDNKDFLLGIGITTTISQTSFMPKQPMRVAPTSLESNSIAISRILAGALATGGTLTLHQSAPEFATIRYTMGSSTFVAGETQSWYGTTSGAYIALNAEL